MKHLASGLWAMKAEALDLLLEQVGQMDQGTPDNLPEDGISSPIMGGVMSINVSGTLVKSGAALMRYCGMDATGYDEIGAALAAADADPTVSAVVLKISSPGGQVDGCQALGDAIASMGKPVVAQVSDLCASAAYWLASQCQSITANRTAMIGSIGVFAVARDTSRLMENMGIKCHLISSGGVKGAGAGGTPVTDEQLAAIKAQIDGVYAHFIQAIVDGRGMDATSVRAVADGRVYLAASAQAAGLIDRIANTAEVYSMNIAPAAMVALIDAHPTRAAHIAKLAAADKTEAEILAEIKDAQTAELAEKSAALIKTLDDVKAKAAADLEAAAVAHAAALKTKDDEIAAMKAKHDALAKLAGNGVRDPGNQHGDPAADAVLPTFTQADASAGKIPAALLASGKYRIADEAA